MTKDKWVWMPHAGHFICGDRCRFHLSTYVGKYIVSTLGEMKSLWNDEEFEDIGCDRKYETMVFKARKSKNKCCPWVQKSGEDVDFDGYNDAGEAYKGHLKMCKKWGK
jgi:hypothetical protein